MPLPTNALLSGPSTVAENTSSTNFTITPTIPITGTYTPNDGGFGGTFTPASLSWAASNTAKTFVYNAPNHPGIAQITPVWMAGGITTNPVFLNITVTGASPAQHIYYFPQSAGVPPFQILQSNDQIPGANVVFTTRPQQIYYYPQVAGVPPFQVLQSNNQIPGAVTPPVVTYTQAIVPTTGAVPATAILTYTLSGVLAVDIVISPSPTLGSFSPATVTILAGSLTGTTTFSLAVAGTATISSTNNQSLTDPANITFVGFTPATTSSRGTQEAGTGTILAIAAGAAVALIGPWQTPYRLSMKEVISVQATGAFNLNYQFSTDNGTTWYPGRQVASTTSSADGTAYTNRAHFKIEPGFFWKVEIFNTGVGAIDAAFERRFLERGAWGT